VGRGDFTKNRGGQVEGEDDTYGEEK